MDAEYVNPIPAEKCETFFRHTSNRWICNEETRLAERYAPFNIGALISIAVNATRSKSCISMDKLTEDTYYRAFVLRMDDGCEIMARISLPTPALSERSICSEVATMEYLRKHSGITVRVPEVYAWEYRLDENPVGVQYMVMEYIGGDPLCIRWPFLSSEELSAVMQELVTIESRIFACEFPKYGSLYYPEHVEEKYRADLIENRFCVGPMAGNEWWAESRRSLEFDRGPWLHPEDYLKACAKREAACTAKIKKLTISENIIASIHRIRPEDHISLLSKYEQVAPYLIPRGKDQFLCPTLRHSNLSLENITLDKDSVQIGSIINWNNASILPYFVQSGIPPLVRRRKGKRPERLQMPELPKTFEIIDGLAALDAEFKLREERTMLFYVAATLLKNPRHLQAIDLPHLVWRQNLIKRAGDPCNGDLVKLRKALIEFREIWNDMYPLSPYPFPKMFTEEEEAFNIRESERWEQALTAISKIQKTLGIDEKGGLDPSCQYESACQLNMKYRTKLAKQQASPEFAEIVWWAWPFRDEGDDSSAPPPADWEGRNSPQDSKPKESGSTPGSPAVASSAGGNSPRGIKRKERSPSTEKSEGTRSPSPVDSEEERSGKCTKLEENGATPLVVEKLNPCALDMWAYTACEWSALVCGSCD